MRLFTLECNKSSYHSNFHIAWYLCYLWESQHLFIEALTNTPCELLIFRYFWKKRDSLSVLRFLNPIEKWSLCFRGEHCILHSRNLLHFRGERRKRLVPEVFIIRKPSTKKMEKCLPKRSLLLHQRYGMLKEKFCFHGDWIWSKNIPCIRHGEIKNPVAFVHSASWVFNPASPKQTSHLYFALPSCCIQLLFVKGGGEGKNNKRNLIMQS